MAGEAVAKMLRYLIVFLIASAIIYAVARLFPGDPITVLYGENPPSEECRKYLASSLALDKPLHMQILLYWRRVFVGDWGKSIFFGEPVASVILRRLLNSLALATLSTVTTTAICIAMAYLSFVYRHKTLCDAASAISASMPAAIWGVVVMSITVLLGGRVEFGSVLYPLATLTVAGVGIFYGILQGILAKVYEEPFISMYIAMGFSKSRIFLKALRYALPVYLSAILYRAGLIVAGAVATETIFGYPGMGKLLIDAFHSRDYPMLIGWAFTVSLVVAFLTALGDALHSYLDPRASRGWG